MADSEDTPTLPENEKVTVTDLEAPIRDVRGLLKVATHLLLENIQPHDHLSNDVERKEAFEQCCRGLTLLTITGEKVAELKCLWGKAFQNSPLAERRCGHDRHQHASKDAD
jgi:hypothetical protein